MTNDPKNRHYGAGGIKAITAFFANYFNFTGRSTRKEYWWWWLWMTIIALMLMVWVPFLAGAGLNQYLADPSLATLIKAFGATLLPAMLFGVLIMIPNISLLIRRYRDAGIPWWVFVIQVVANRVLQSTMDVTQGLGNFLALLISLSLFVLVLLPSKKTAK